MKEYLRKSYRTSNNFWITSYLKLNMIHKTKRKEINLRGNLNQVYYIKRMFETELFQFRIS